MADELVEAAHLGNVEKLKDFFKKGTVRARWCYLDSLAPIMPLKFLQQFVVSEGLVDTNQIQDTQQLKASDK